MMKQEAIGWIDQKIKMNTKGITVKMFYWVVNHTNIFEIQTTRCHYRTV